MPPRNPELPEGTDHIINGAMETNAGAGAGSTTGASSGFGAGSTGGLAGGTGVGVGGGSGSGFIGGSDTSVLGDDTGGTSDAGFAKPTGGGQGGTAVSQLKGGAQDLRQKATSKVRDYAEDGKSRATTALDDFSNVVREAADSIDDKLGAEYGQYARKAADAVADFSQNVRTKNVDELYDEARSVVRKSPAVAIGIAAAVGFALVRLVKAGVPDPERDVEFEPDPEFGTGTASAATGSAPYVAPATRT